MARSTEKQLDAALDDALQSNPDFLQWFLSHTKFSGRGASYLWSRSDHPWGTIDFRRVNPDTGAEEVTRRECETDVLLVVRAQDGSHLALHIENKLSAGSFTSDQPEMYAQRAKQWKNIAKDQSYIDFCTFLVAPPREFRNRNEREAAAFDVFIAHQEIAQHVPLLGAIVNV